MIDALAYEVQFLDHLAPVWRRLPARGVLLVPPELLRRSQILGLEATALRVDLHRPPAGDPLRRALVASYGDVKKARRLGYGAFAFLEHGAGQSYNGVARHAGHPSYPGGIDRADHELFLVPNAHSAGEWRRRYPRARVAIVRPPRLDELPARVPSGETVVAISFHPTFLFAPEVRSAWSHYKAALPALARQVRLIGHAHPRHADVLAREYRRAGVEYVADFADVCRRADVYVADNTSTLFEFASTGRPVVVLNAPWYRRDVEHGLRFWSASSVGVQVDGPAELLPAIARALEDGEELRQARAAALELVYAPGAADPVDVLAEWLGAAVAA